MGGGWHGGGHGSFVFVVSETDRETMLRADNASDGNRWVRGLTLQIDLVHGGTFQGPPSNKNRRRGATVVRTGGVSSEVEGRRRYPEGGSEGYEFRDVNDRVEVKKRKEMNRPRTERLGGGGGVVGKCV